MASVLETFFVKLGFEVDEKGLQNAQAKIAEFGKSILELGGIALSFAGLTELTLHTAEAMAQVELLSERTGIATDMIAGMTKAARDFDISAQDVQNTLEQVNVDLGGVIDGTAPRMVRVFKLLGLSAKDAAGQQKDLMTFLGDVADKIQGKSTGAQQQLLNRLGISPNMVLMLRNGRQAFLDLYAAAHGGIPWKEEDFKRAEDFSKSWRNAKAALSAVGTAIGLELMPIFKRFSDAFLAWWKGSGKQVIAEARAGIKAIADRLVQADDAFKEMSGGVDLLTFSLRLLLGVVTILLARSIASWAGAGISALDKLAGMAGKAALDLGTMAAEAFYAATGLDAEAAAAEAATVSTLALTGWGLLLAAVLAALAATIYLLIDDFIAWRKGGESVIGMFQQKFPQAFAIAQKAVLFLRDSFLELWNSIKGLYAVIGPPLLFLLKWLLIIAGVVVGVVVAAIILLSYVAVVAITKILTWLARLETFLLKLIPVNLIKELWDSMIQHFVKSLNDTTALFTRWGNYIKTGWDTIVNATKAKLEEWGADIKGIWQDVVDFFQPLTDAILAGWEMLTDTTAWQDFAAALTAIWQGIGDAITQVWQDFAASFKSIWDEIMGWLNPILKRIESGFSFLKNVGAAFEMHGTPMAPIPAMAGGVPVGVPTVGNTPHTETTTHKTDIKVTQNIQTSDPKVAGDQAAAKINETRQRTTRNAQSRHR